jgi:hypothetical protein
MASKAEVVAKLLLAVEKKLGRQPKASLGDYIRLVQLQKELEEDEVREIKVRWIDPEAQAAAKAKTRAKAKPTPKRRGPASAK